jgi:tetraacyldisaccharide 4'-kinase
MFRNVVLRVLLSPFALIYGIIISLINFSYDIGLLKSSRFSIPVIGVGNLSIGGAGKTPHIEYLIDLLKDYINVATLSRGYKRETSGFRLVQYHDTALTVGDEPLQYRRKYRGYRSSSVGKPGLRHSADYPKLSGNTNHIAG